MGWTYTYYCKRLGVTFKQGDRFIVKGKSYISAYYDAAAGTDYSNEPSEKVFYGYYTDPTYPDTVKYPIHFTNAEGSRQYYISDDSIYANVSGTLDKYTVSFNANGGSGAPSAQTKTHGITLTLSSTKPTRTGYTFLGWSTTNDSTVDYNSGSQYTLNQNITLYAVWQVNTYTITYKANGAEGSDKTQEVTYGISWKTQDKLYSLDGHEQTSWNTRPDGSGVRYGLNTDQTNTQLSDLTLYAIYTPKTYELTVDPNGGTWNGSTSVQKFRQEYESSKDISDPSRVGFKFVKWSLSGSGIIEDKKYYFGAGNGTLTAQWKRIELTVTFDASTNGGSPDGTKIVYYGDTVGFVMPPTKPFYKFIGWYTKPVGGTKIEQSQVVTSDVTYYAQFKIDASVKVKYNGKKVPAIVWLKVNGVWKKCVTWVKSNGKWKKSSGAD